MTRRIALAIVLGACAPNLGKAPRVPEPANAPGATHESTTEPANAKPLSWESVRTEIETLICMRTFEVPGHAPFEEPIFGHRDTCELPPASTPLERAVQDAYLEAQPMLSAMRHEWLDSVVAATMLDDPAARLLAARRAYLGDRFVAVLMAYVRPRLDHAGLSCDGCPDAIAPPSRTLRWQEFAPYLGKYTWPDPIVTKEASYGMHICIGTNGISEIPEADGALIELGFLAAFHTDLVRETARAHYDALRGEPAFERLRDDATRTRFARDNLGPRIAAEPAIRTAVCRTIERFEPVTGLTIEECEGWR